MNTYKTDPILFEEKAEILKVISNPARLCIVRTLCLKDNCNVTDMQACLNKPQSTVSQHISKLKAAKIIVGKRKGKEVYYSLNNGEVRNIINSLFND